jgi:hypothetical protein
VKQIKTKLQDPSQDLGRGPLRETCAFTLTEVVQDYASTNSVILKLEIVYISRNVRIFTHHTVHKLKRQPSLRVPQNGQTNYKQSAHVSLLAGDQPENKFAFRLARL